jgi:ribosomal protein L37AE/L43A
MAHFHLNDMSLPEADYDDDDEQDTPEATCHECGETFPMRRAMLGYNVCLTCGDIVASSQRASWCIVPTPKGHYTRVTNKADLLHLNQKTR